MAEEIGCSAEEIASLELNICDVQPSCLGGGNNEFIFSGRLDNLASSYCALRALIDSSSSPRDLQDERSIRMVALFDNEEVSIIPEYSAPRLFLYFFKLEECLCRFLQSGCIVSTGPFIFFSFFVLAKYTTGGLGFAAGSGRTDNVSSNSENSRLVV